MMLPMRSVVGDKLGVKASGGVRTPEDAEKFIAAGATPTRNKQRC